MWSAQHSDRSVGEGDRAAVPATPKAFVYLYATLAGCLFVYVLLRAARMSFTHDESLSYTIVTGNGLWALSANNHWANTISAFLSSRIFGYSELALRLPNVIAFIFYLTFVYGLFTGPFFSRVSALVVLPLFLFNPFLLDFFSLSRGYGLALAFFTGCIYFSLRSLNDASYRTFALAAICAIVCVYSSFSFVIAVFAIQFGHLLFWRRASQFDVKRTVKIYAWEALALAPGLCAILYLASTDKFYAGGVDDVFSDTLRSLAIYSFGPPFFEQQQLTLLVAAGWVYLAALLGKRSSELRILVLACALLLVVPTLLNWAVGFRFAVDRSATCWLPLFGVLAHCAIRAQWTSLLRSGLLVSCAMLSALLAAEFVRSANLKFTRIWKYDADTRNVLELLAQNRAGGDIRLGIDWHFEPAVNYYRETRGYGWLERVTRDGVTSEYDFYYLAPANRPKIPAGCLQEIAYFPDAEAVLIRNCSRHTR
jgi:hypothetical protein